LLPGQDFIDADELKNCLFSIFNERELLNEDEKIKWDEKYKYFPPDDSNSLISNIHKKFMKFENKSKFSLKENPDYDIDVLIKKRRISIYSPCYCGSGKKLKDCHLDEIRKAEAKNNSK
jgi:hypothetical protein